MKRSGRLCWRNTSIRTQLYSVMLVTLALVIAIFFWALESITAILEQKNEEYLDEIITMECTNLERKFAELSNIIYGYGYEASMQALVNCEDSAEYYALYETVASHIKLSLFRNEGIVDYVFLGKNRNFSVTGAVGGAKRLRERAGMDFTVKALGPVYYHYDLPEIYLDGWESMPMLLFGSPIYSYSGELRDMEYIGYSAVVCRSDLLLINSDERENLGTEFYLVDAEGIVCAQSGGAPLYGDRLENALSADEYRIEKTGVGLDMQLISVTDYGELYDGLSRVRTRFLKVFAFGMLVILMIFALAIRGIVRPITNLSRFIAMMRFTRLEAFNQRVDLTGSKEIVGVARQLNRMLEQIRQLTQSLLEANNRLHESRLEQERAKLYSLRSQINPHFLYNTLECAKGLAYQHGMPSLAHMLDSMARIFRYSIKGSGMVLLEDELETAKAYLSIQHARFCGRFESNFEIAGRARGAVIPKMTLQPLIENSIFHGVEPSMKPCHVYIRARVSDEEELVLEVEDDGQGMDAQALKALCARLENYDEKNEAYASIGIGNIAHRIRLIYGAGYGVQIASELGKGTRITIRLPYKEDFV